MNELRPAVKALRERIGGLALEARKAGLPVIILLEGWGASGKGELAGKLISEIDPRFFKVISTGAPTTEDLRYPFMRRFWKTIPEHGSIAVLDRSWYREINIAAVEDNLGKKELARRTAEILEFEYMLCDDGYLILKFFLRISKDEQKKRFKKLERDAATSWRVTEADWNRQKHYDDYRDAFDNMLSTTDFPDAPWYNVDAFDSDSAALTVCSEVAKQMEHALASLKEQRAIPGEIRVSPDIMPLPIQKLSEIDLSASCPDELYNRRISELQDELFELHNKLYRAKKPLIVVYEGWDAAGKGGNIKRLTSGLDPRGYEVVPICAPTKPELNRQYLWRFWMGLPRSGHIAIYDRSWYGRVMVERIEGFCTETQWKRAYDEINRFERSLRDWGAIIIKIWLHIDSDTQLARFTERQNTPGKQWKITPEDWRNREKWSQYEQCVNQMLALTNTEYAPWVAVASNDKKHARITALEAVVEQIKKYI
jgi:polyphosphate:AMP phosphotransferase